MAQHEKQHNGNVATLALNDEVTITQETKPRIQVKNPAELIDKINDNMEDRIDPKDMLEIASSADIANKTTGRFRLYFFKNLLHIMKFLE